MQLGGAVGTLSALDGRGLAVVEALADELDLAEGVAGRGGSSTMPHKRNPVAAVSARAGAVRAPGLVAGLLAGMAQEHERAAGAWQAKSQALSDVLRCTGSAAAWLRDALEHLVVDPARMRAGLTGAALGVEAVAGALTGRLGRTRAQDRVAEAVRAGGDLRATLLADPDVRAVLDEEQLDDLLDPVRHLGQAPALVDRVLAAHDRRARPHP